MKIKNLLKQPGLMIGFITPIFLFYLPYIASLLGIGNTYITKIASGMLYYGNMIIGSVFSCPVTNWGIISVKTCNDIVYLICIPLLFGIIFGLIGLGIQKIISLIRR